MPTDYELLDSGDFEKLERFGDHIIRRPSPGAVWTRQSHPKWERPDAIFIRHSTGDGSWKGLSKSLPNQWNINVEGLIFQIERTPFGHLGIFPEQKENWIEFQKIKKPLRVLNLFAYTGGSTIACAKSNCIVTHVDASKTSTTWARINSKLNGLSEAPIRYIVEDVNAFVKREIRRNSKYDAIILDPPSFGRGKKAQIWKIEEHLNPLLFDLKDLLSNTPEFICLSSHSTGYTPKALENMLQNVFQPNRTSAKEMLLTGQTQSALPSGASSIAYF